MALKGNACVAIVTASLAVGLSACGGSDENAIVVHVGNSAITKATVDHWTDVVRRGGAFTGFRGKPSSSTTRQMALSVLISSTGLIGEAERHGLPVSGHVADQAIAQQIQGSGGADLRKRLAATGQTIADFKLELEAELALEAIREELASRASQITTSDVVAFYRKNPREFGTPETRVVDIIEKLPSAPAATALVRRIGTGLRFARLAYHKQVVLTPGILNGPETKKRVDYAIFAARPGVASPPMRLGEGWAVFIVRKVLSARAEPLAKVHGEVVASLLTERKREVIRTAELEYKRHWISRTSCRPGYVAPGCAQYHGAPGEYADPFIED